MKAIMLVLVGLVIGSIIHEPIARAWSDNDLGRAINNIDASLTRIANALEKCK
jgi:hypothetical protein